MELETRIRAFLEDPATDDFNALALASFAYQFEAIPAYRDLCGRKGIGPGAIADWTQVPAVPALAFKSLALNTAPARETFLSSGTTGSAPSRHLHPFPDLYRAAIDASFPAACLHPMGGEVAPILALVPRREQAPNSSLSFMIDHVVARYGAPASAFAFGPHGVEAAMVRSWLGARQREGRPVLIVATAFALAQLFEALSRFGLRYRLPAGSVVFETGGFKGRTRELSRDEMLERLQDLLTIAPSSVVSEYGMTELSSQFYTRLGGDDPPGVFFPQHWTRIRILDPDTLVEAPTGKTGILAIFDLANLGSVVHLLTEDLGVAEGGGFRLAGRASGAELRGCSLTVEELMQRP